MKVNVWREAEVFENGRRYATKENVCELKFRINRCKKKVLKLKGDARQQQKVV